MDNTQVRYGNCPIASSFSVFFRNFDMYGWCCVKQRFVFKKSVEEDWSVEVNYTFVNRVHESTVPSLPISTEKVKTNV